MLLARGEGCATLDVLAFRGFLAGGLVGGGGVARGVSCGDSSELMSIVSCSNADRSTWHAQSRPEPFELPVGFQQAEQS